MVEEYRLNIFFIIFIFFKLQQILTLSVRNIDFDVVQTVIVSQHRHFEDEIFEDFAQRGDKGVPAIIIQTIDQNPFSEVAILDGWT